MNNKKKSPIVRNPDYRVSLLFFGGRILAANQWIKENLASPLEPYPMLD